MKTILALLILTVGASAYTKAQLYELKNLKVTAYAARDAAEFYDKKAESLDSIVKKYQTTYLQTESKWKAKKRSAGCRTDSCKHPRSKTCYKMARTLNGLSADLKKQDIKIKKITKERDTQRAFADKKSKEYKSLCSEYLKKRKEWR